MHECVEKAVGERNLVLYRQVIGYVTVPKVC